MKALLKKLIGSETTAEAGELCCAEILREAFCASGIATTIDVWGQNRANITARVKSSGLKGGLLIACHLDVVGVGEGRWQNEPFCGAENGGRIYGRGSADMKGGTAAAVTAIREVVESGVKLAGDIVFVGCAGEETDSCGAKKFVDGWADGKPAGVVIPEPTDFEVVTAHRGMLWLEVVTSGKAAHGSQPQLGVNAIDSMRLFLDEFDKYEIGFGPHRLLGRCSKSVNAISGGKEINVVPDVCKAKIDIRTLPGQNHERIVSDIEAIFSGLKRENSDFEGDVSVVREVDAMETDSKSAFVKEFCSVVGAEETKAVGFTTDGPHFAKLGGPVVIFGPGKPEVCHKADEYIEIADVEKAVGYYKDIILKFLG